MEDFSEIVVVWRGETARALKSGRFLALVVLFVMAEALSLTIVGFINTQANEQFDQAVASQGADPEKARAVLLTQKKKLLTLFTDSSDERTIEAISALPLVLLVVFALTKFFVPLLIAFMGFDQISGELGPKSIRYLIVRARRNSIILGKFLSQLTMLAALLTLCVLTMVVVSKVLNPEFAARDAVLWTAKLTAALVVIGATYAALTTLCSSLTRVSALALFVNLIALFAFWFIGLIGNAWRIPGHPPTGLDLVKAESYLAFARYLVPGQFEDALLSPALVEFNTGLVAHLGFTLTFLGLAQLALKRRDL
jgi:ABC-type transport system involved in multi-copper enzyme maturation permease subunit